MGTKVRQSAILGVLVATMGGATVSGCGPAGRAPQLDPIGDQVAFVGSEFRLTMKAADADLDGLRFLVDSDIDNIEQRSQVRRYGEDGSTSVFTWTPVAQDVGTHSFEVQVTDGTFTSREQFQIEVRSSVGANSAPRFSEPLGTGTTLDLGVEACVNLAIRVEDSDSAEVEITQEAEAIEGAELTQTAGLEASWKWCPTPEQTAAQDRYVLVLGADDRDNPKTLKNFLIVLRRTPKPGCAGTPPTIAHTPMDETSGAGLSLFARIADAEGLKAAPILYYSLTPPAAPPADMTQVEMILIDGTMTDGDWGADVPNPTAGSQGATSKKLYYVIVATDDDDPMGDCDNITQAPATGYYEMTVTNPGGAGGAMQCEACTKDIQCGGQSDLCVRIGNTGGSYCGKACTADAQCGTNYVCSAPVTSVDGTTARQCIPANENCAAPGPAPQACVDDAQEDNDSRATSRPLAVGTLPGLRSCPADSAADDEDWFKFTVAADTEVTLTIAGGQGVDLDLALVDAAGATLTRSTSLTSNETIVRCLTPGTYHARIYTVARGENTYSLTMSQKATSCGGAAACLPDVFEPDSTRAAANFIPLSQGKFETTTHNICTGDKDYYEMYLLAGDVVTAQALFTDASGDIDLYFHDAAGTVLTPCCQVDNGQSVTDNERLTYTATSTGYYFLSVEGYEQANVSYGLCVSLEPADCPRP